MCPTTTWVRWGLRTAVGGPGSSLPSAPGMHHNCGVRRDGSVACWGDDRLWPGDAAGRGVRLRQRRVDTHLRGEAGRLRRLLGLGTDMARRRRRPGSSPPSAPGGATPAG